MAAESQGLRPVTASIGVTIAVVPAVSTALTSAIPEPVTALVRDLHREVVDVAVSPLAEVLADEADRAVVLVWSAEGIDAAICAQVVAWADARKPRPGLIGWAAGGTHVDAETALATGFDDIVVGACSPRELAARIRAVHRRVHWQGSRRPGRIRYGTLLLDTDGHELWIDGKTVTLTSTELAVVRALMRAGGRTMSRTELLDHAWGSANFEISERAVDNVILRLRRKLGKSNLIQTVRGVGFRLSPDE